MPLYEYKCVKCRRHFTRIEKLSGPHLKKCPHCGARVERMASAPAIQFKGSGWYITDYARSSKNAESKVPDGSTESGKPAEKSEAKTSETVGAAKEKKEKKKTATKDK